MRTTLYIFSLLWFLTGVVLIVLGATLGIVPPVPLMPTPQAGTTHLVFGNPGAFLLLAGAAAWALVFFLPALLIAAMGTMLKRLEDIARLPAIHSNAREHDVPVRKRSFADKVEPHIGKV